MTLIYYIGNAIVIYIIISTKLAKKNLVFVYEVRYYFAFIKYTKSWPIYSILDYVCNIVYLPALFSR